MEKKENKTFDNQFKTKLKNLLNEHNIENECDMPDFLLADMIVNFIIAVGVPIKKTLDWHGCNSGLPSQKRKLIK